MSAANELLTADRLLFLEGPSDNALHAHRLDAWIEAADALHGRRVLTSATATSYQQASLTAFSRATVLSSASPGSQEPAERAWSGQCCSLCRSGGSCWGAVTGRAGRRLSMPKRLELALRRVLEVVLAVARLPPSPSAPLSLSQNLWPALSCSRGLPWPWRRS